ncbi:MAG: HAD hydrolase-like protein, partial [Desulfobacterales bacterium]|nr:HAD hydrolase-like protein [Desulfobacterales bacterium]
FIGDTARDLQAGQAAGISCLLVRTGHGRDTEADLKNYGIKNIEAKTVFIFDDLLSACMAITD